MKVLYADSDPEVRDYVSMLLEAGLDCEIMEASSGNEALSILGFDDDVDFVISEVQMPGGGGHLIVDYLDSHKKMIPFVWLSEKDNQETMVVQEVLQRSPLNAFVPKPFRDDQFFPVIDKILQIKTEIKENRPIVQNSQPPSGKHLKQDDEEEEVNFDDEWDDIANGKYESSNSKDSSSFDWDTAKKGHAKEGSADWSLGLKKKGGEQEGDWGSLTGQGQEGEADWSLKKDFKDSGEEEADWGSVGGAGQEGEADWSLKKEFNPQEGDTLDYGKPGGDAWETIRKQNQAKKKDKGKSKEEGESSSEMEYDMERFKRIKIKRFYNFQKVCCDVYIQLSPKKYIKLINGNDSYESSFIKRYEDRGKKYLFIENEHFEMFEQQFGHLVLDKLEKAQNLPPDVRAVAELAAFNHTLDFAKQFGVTANTANKVKKSVESNLKTLKKLPKLELLLKRIMRGGDYISEHSLLVSYLAGQICMGTSWGNNQALEKLSMAALLHDVSLPKNNLAKVHTLSQAKEMGLSEKEIEIIKSHPGEAAKMVSEGENIFADVDTIVMQHHELPDQSGFPRGLGALSILPLSCIFIMASELAEHIYGKSANDVDMDAIKSEFQERFNKGNFKKPLEAFLKVF